MYAIEAARLNFRRLRPLLKVCRARAPEFPCAVIRSLRTATERSDIYCNFDANISGNGNYNQSDGFYGGELGQKDQHGKLGAERLEFHSNMVENQLDVNSGNQNSGFNGRNLDGAEQSRNVNRLHEYNFRVQRGKDAPGDWGNGQQNLAWQNANFSGYGDGSGSGLLSQNRSAVLQRNPSGEFSGWDSSGHSIGGNKDMRWPSTQRTEPPFQNGAGIYCSSNAGNYQQNWTETQSDGVPHSPVPSDMKSIVGQVEVAGTGRNQTRSKMELLDEYIREGELKVAMEHLGQLQKEGVQVDLPRYMALMKACGEMQAVDEAKAVHEHLLRSTMHLEVRTYNKILEMYSSCGSMEDAHRVFTKMVKRNLTSWDIMISGLAKNGLGEDALELFTEFKRSGLEPDGQMFIGVFSACGVVCDILEGMLHFESMKKDYGIAPTMEHYVGIVGMMGCAGCLDEALEFIERMQLEPSVEIWETLMKFCRIHGNAELGDRCVELIELFEPSRLNEQSRAGLMPINPSEVAKKKSRGENLPDITRRIHEYRAGDRSQPNHEKIYGLLWGLKQQLKEIGYVPDTKFVLHDVDQEEREEAIMAHSERLAAAQGFLTTAARSPMRIIKNLRVCGDCHNIFKMISKVVGREIIARDSKRFHHFKDGLCSCNDYW